MASFLNIYTHRKVAATAAKSCEICFKPSTSVLLASGNKDFFYVCDIHLTDKGFCKPLVEQVSATVDSRRQIDEEIKRLRKEYEDKIDIKSKQRNTPESSNPSKEKYIEKEEENEKSTNPVAKAKHLATSIINEPREFALVNMFYQHRLERRRNFERKKQNLERLRNPTLLPQVPKGLP